MSRLVICRDRSPRVAAELVVCHQIGQGYTHVRRPDSANPFRAHHPNPRPRAPCGQLIDRDWTQPVAAKTVGCSGCRAKLEGM